MASSSAIRRRTASKSSGDTEGAVGLGAGVVASLRGTCWATKTGSRLSPERLSKSICGPYFYGSHVDSKVRFGYTLRTLLHLPAHWAFVQRGARSVGPMPVSNPGARSWAAHFATLHFATIFKPAKLQSCKVCFWNFALCNFATLQFWFRKPHQQKHERIMLTKSGGRCARTSWKVARCARSWAADPSGRRRDCAHTSDGPTPDESAPELARGWRADLGIFRASCCA